MTVLVSACLLGVPCRYDGQSKRHPLAQELCRRHRVIPVCGEIFGGLPTPRPPAEICGQRVVTREGADVTAAYRRGAEAVLELARLTGAEAAVLKERSPSCGSGAVYDGHVLRHADGGLGRCRRASAGAGHPGAGRVPAGGASAAGRPLKSQQNTTKNCEIRRKLQMPLTQNAEVGKVIP